MSDFQPLEDWSNLTPPHLNIYISQRLSGDLTMGVLRQMSGISSTYFQICYPGHPISSDSTSLPATA